MIESKSGAEEQMREKKTKESQQERKKVKLPFCE